MQKLALLALTGAVTASDLQDAHKNLQKLENALQNNLHMHGFTYSTRDMIPRIIEYDMESIEHSRRAHKLDKRMKKIDEARAEVDSEPLNKAIEGMMDCDCAKAVMGKAMGGMQRFQEAKEADPEVTGYSGHFCGCEEAGEHAKDPIAGLRIPNENLEKWNEEDKVWFNDFVAAHGEEMKEHQMNIAMGAQGFAESKTGRKVGKNLKKFFRNNKEIERAGFDADVIGAKIAGEGHFDILDKPSFWDNPMEGYNIPEGMPTEIPDRMPEAPMPEAPMPEAPEAVPEKALQNNLHITGPRYSTRDKVGQTIAGGLDNIEHGDKGKALKHYLKGLEKDKEALNDFGPTAVAMEEFKNCDCGKALMGKAMGDMKRFEEAKAADPEVEGYSGHFCGCEESGEFADDPIAGLRIPNEVLEGWNEEDKAWSNQFVKDHWDEFKGHGMNIAGNMEQFKNTTTGHNIHDAFEELKKDNMEIEKFDANMEELGTVLGEDAKQGHWAIKDKPSFWDDPYAGYDIPEEFGPKDELPKPDDVKQYGPHSFVL